MSITGRTERIELCTSTVEQEVAIAAAPEVVYRALTAEVGYWWDPNWVMGGPATSDVVIEAVPGGRWMEVWGEGEGFLWGTVIRARKNRSLTISVPEGVIWSGPGSISIDLVEDGEGTLLKLVHSSTQIFEEDSHSGYVQGWTALFGGNLRTYVETGERMGVRKD